MVRITYHCPYCGAVTGVDREGYLRDESVTREPLAGWEYAATTGDLGAADGIEFVCLGDVDPTRDGDDAGPQSADAADDAAGGPNEPEPGGEGCGRTFYVNFVRYEDGERVAHRTPEYDGPRFDFRP